MSAWTLGCRCVATFAICAFSIACSAQAPGTGSYPYARSDSFGFDSINPGNLNIHFAIPIVSKPGRGGLDFNYSLVYDSLIWTPVTVGSSKVWSPEPSFGLHGYLLNEGYKGFLSYSSVTKKCFDDPNNPGYYDLFAVQSLFVYHDEFGIQHPFNYSYSFCTGIATGNGSSQDNSGFAYDGANVRSPSGNILFVPSVMNGATNSTNGAITDSNGNQITNGTSGTFTDTMNTTPLIISGSGTPALPRKLTYYTTGGSHENATVNYTAKTIQTAFGCSGVTEFGPTSVNLPTSIVLGDGSSTYTIAYDTSGRVTSITLPAGGTIYYTYASANHGINCSDGTTGGVSRHTSISTDGTTSYTRPTIGSTTSHTEITGAHGDQTEVDYTFAGGVPYETTRRVYSGASSGGTLLARTDTCYNGQVPTSCTTQSLTMPFNQISVYRTIGSVENGSDSFYNAYGQPTDIKEYDYGSGARGTTVLRETKYTYAVLGSYITDKIASVQQYDGAGHEFAATTYGYDDTTLQVTSGLFQHVAASGPRGNLTSEYDYINGSTYLTNHAQADDAGQILSTWGSNPGTISYGYTSQDTLLTTITPPQPNGVSLNTQFGHDSYTGLLTSTTDPNSQVTNYKYDALLRQSELDFPDGGKTTYGYLNTTQVGIYDYQNATTHTDTEILNDGLGRQIRTAVANGQGTNPWYQNDFCPSATTLTSFSSYRYQGNGLTTGQVCSGTGGDLTTYDPLGRITQVHHGDGTSLTYQYAGRATKVTDENGVGRISQVDGLGRLTAACEISSNSLLGSGSPASCALDISGIGYLTTYSYNLATLTTTITQGAQQRQFQTDWLGRPDLVKEPESGQTTYSYAYNGTGLVVTRVRPTANQSNPSTTTTTTSQYDSLGRLSSVSYSDGTPTKNYLYDASSQWGNSLQNTKGRLIEQSVGPGIGIAGTIFSYDPMGRVIWFAQCTPSTCGSRAFSASYSYDHSGNMLTGGDGFMSYTYSYSPANEFLSITSSLNDSQHPPHLVSNVTNGPFGPLTWSLGNGLSGVRRYDGLGRLTGGWVCNGSASIFCAGGSQVYGFTVGWSGARVASSTDTAMGQGMTYGYDEFDRLNSSTVTSGTTQNFSYVYDRYGNRLQQNVTAGTGPAPVYSINTSNNQITSSGFVYDAAGNVTNDTFHSYSFDAEGNVTKVDGGSTNKFTFDGFNHRVRVDWTGGAEELIFNPVGLQASGWNPVTSSQYAGWAYWGESPVASYGAGTTAFGHQDWLGTERTRTSYNGQVIGSYTSLAFGDAFTVNGSDLVANHFTGLLHDYGSNTDHAQFRQYNPTEGRWLSPDPYSGSYDFTNPQSLNRYAYAMNSPMAATDPSGLDLKDQWCDLFGDCGGGGGGASGDGGDPGGCDPIFYDCDGSGGYIGDVGYGPAPDPKQFVDLDPNRTMTESLGLPPGMLVPSADIVGMLQGGLGLPEAGCEFGACGAGPMDLTPGQQASTAASSSDMEYDIFHCPSCANTWRQSNTVVKGASIATVVAVAAVPLAGEAATSAAGDALFARGAGLLNANNVLRIGWGWYGAHIIDNLPTGGEVFRVVVGCPSCIIHWHIWPF